MQLTGKQKLVLKSQPQLEITFSPCETERTNIQEKQKQPYTLNTSTFSIHFFHFLFFVCLFVWRGGKGKGKERGKKRG